MLTCAVATVVVVLTGLVISLAAAAAGRQRAGGAADLAALAAAARALSGQDIACATAGSVAEANGARLKSCRVEGLRAWVVTGVDVHIGVLDGAATGRALAGPVDEAAE